MSPAGDPPGEDDGEEESLYGTALEEAFIAERGTPFLLSSKDWLLIRGWRAHGIPVDTAIRAVQEVFEKRRSRGQTGKISSIAYCANAVEERWELERRGLVGSVDSTQGNAVATEIAPRLAVLAEALGAARERTPAGVDVEAYRKAVSRAIEKLAALDTGKGFDELEDALSSIEGSLMRKLRTALDDETAAALERRVDELLGDPAGLSPSVAERTRKALGRREIRRLFELPSLTLFPV